MSRDKYRDAAFQVIVDMLDIHDPADPDLPQAHAIRTAKGAEITLSDQDTGKVLGSWRIELVSLKETDEWSHVIMKKPKGSSHAVVISRHRSKRAAAEHMQRRGFSRLHGYEIYKLVASKSGRSRAIEVGDKLYTTIVSGDHCAYRPGG